ncbi:MAG: hypothetical protein ACRELC_13925 [Gemmatimonadota bacterium]
MRRARILSALFFALTPSAACYVVPWGPTDPQVERALRLADPPCAVPKAEEEDEPRCDLDAHWSLAPRGAWEACSRPI